MLNDEELFGCADSFSVTGCEEELDEVIGEKGVEHEKNFVIFLSINNSDIHFSFSAI